MLRFATPLLALFILGGCMTTGPAGQHQIDWKQTDEILEDARLMAEGFRPLAVERDREESVDRVVQAIDTARAAVALRIADESQEPVAVDAVRAVLDVAGEVIATWPDPQQRAVASGIYVSVRHSLRMIYRASQRDD